METVLADAIAALAGLFGIKPEVFGAVVLVLFVISEVLVFIPAVKANSVVQAVINVVKALYAKVAKKV